ncbi:unnamed protein product [Blepharisma stoltei]|uniref:Timeless N-terminal domain-containing protein n=1 Tax=Blepharisma stoltei TaxID=1481888 RepID=A0AAU9JLD6_9CILI|nr:unnamed protein product [Blepharisma stoltei]
MEIEEIPEEQEVINLSESEESDELVEEVHLDPKEINDLLFLVQSLGCTKTVGNVETYIKSQECVEFLKELYKILRNENPDSTLKRLELGEWNVVESDLLKLLVSYPEDRQLAFYCIIVLVSLTEKPDKSNYNQQKYIESLQNYKLSVITSKDAIKVIVNHLAECLSKPTDQRNEQHDQMLELIVYLFRNLLAVPDKTSHVLKASKGIAIYNSREDNMKDLQTRFLHKLADETVLEAIVYLCQDFTNPVVKKLNLCFLEIFYHIFKNFQPGSMWAKEAPVSLLQALREKEMENQKLQMKELPTRHSRFGSSYKVQRSMDKTTLVYHNPFKERIEANKIPGQMNRARPQRKENMISLPSKKSEQELAKIDKFLLEKIRKFAEEVLDHCFSPLVETIFVEFYKESERLEDEDKTYYFLFQAFMFEFLRKKHACKSEVLDIDVSPIAEALKLPNFEYLYRSFLYEFKKTSKKEFNTRELHAALKFCTEFLYIIRDMNNSQTETTRRNAQILMQNVFYHEISRVCRKSFEYWKAGVNDKEFLEDIVEFTHMTFKILEEYSQGKALTVRTDKLSRKKKKKEKEGEEGEEEEDEENQSQNEEDEETSYQERQLNFVVEFSLLIDHDVISKYIFLLKRFKENTDMVNIHVVSFLDKVINECMADWVLFQMEYINIFDEILNDKTSKNNPKYKDIYHLVSTIVTRFFALFEKNRLLVVESLFKISDKNIKNQILSNYEGISTTNAEDQDMDENIYSQPNKEKKTKWAREEDEILIDNWNTFKDLESVYEILAGLLKDKTAQQVQKRVKVLKLNKGIEKAKQAMREIYCEEDIYDLRDAVPRAYNKYGKDTIISAIESIMKDYQVYLEEVKTGEYAIIPITIDQFELYNDKDFGALLVSLGARPPTQGEWCWRVSNSLDEITHAFENLKLINETQAEEENEEEYTSNTNNLIYSQLMSQTETAASTLEANAENLEKIKKDKKKKKIMKEKNREREKNNEKVKEKKKSAKALRRERAQMIEGEENGGNLHEKIEEMMEESPEEENYEIPSEKREESDGEENEYNAGAMASLFQKSNPSPKKSDSEEECTYAPGSLFN